MWARTSCGLSVMLIKCSFSKRSLVKPAASSIDITIAMLIQTLCFVRAPSTSIQFAVGFMSNLSEVPQTFYIWSDGGHVLSSAGCVLSPEIPYRLSQARVGRALSAHANSHRQAEPRDQDVGYEQPREGDRKEPEPDEFNDELAEVVVNEIITHGCILRVRPARPSRASSALAKACTLKSCSASQLSLGYQLILDAPRAAAPRSTQPGRR